LQLDDWYSVPRYQVDQRGNLLKHYASFCDALRALYPYHPWDPSRFRNRLANSAQLLAALHRAEDQLGIQKV